MRVAVQKLSGVESVEVSLEKGVATIRFRPEATATYGQVRRAILDNGFTPKEAQVRVRGSIVEQAGRVVLSVPGRGESYPLSGASSTDGMPDRLRQAIGARVEILGTIREQGVEGRPPTVEVVELIRLSTGG